MNDKINFELIASIKGNGRNFKILRGISRKKKADSSFCVIKKWQQSSAKIVVASVGALSGAMERPLQRDMRISS